MRYVIFAIEEVKRPEPVCEKKRATLRNWSLITRTSEPSIWVQLRGQVYGHPKFAEGETVYTSPVIKLDIPGRNAETLHTQYTLE